MVLPGGTVSWIFFIVASVWILVLSVLLFRMIGHYNRLTAGITKSGLKDVLESILTSHRDSQKKIAGITEVLQTLTRDGKRHIARIGIVRFNPFHDTGGSQSFTLAILDSEDNGVVMTSLFARNSHRWYVKEVNKGRGKDVALSKEEETAIKIAKPA